VKSHYCGIKDLLIPIILISNFFSKKPYFIYRAYGKPTETKPERNSLRFKIKIELKKRDFTRLTDFLNENPKASFELFPGVDFEFIAVSPLLLSVKGFGFSIKGKVSFQRPIGMEVFDSLKLDSETSKTLAINYRNIKLSKILTEANELENDLKECLNIVERIVNHTCNMLDKLVEKSFTINSEGFDKQFDVIVRAEELEKRGEVVRPFGLIHGMGRKDAVDRAGGLVPVYMESDKTYLYKDNRVYILLPRDFVMKLLRMDESTLVPSDQFTDEENEVLRKFSMRKYIQTRKVVGKVFYHNLNEKTRKLLLKGMKKL
jgi:hypothetical protein